MKRKERKGYEVVDVPSVFVRDSIAQCYSFRGTHGASFYMRLLFWFIYMQQFRMQNGWLRGNMKQRVCWFDKFTLSQSHHCSHCSETAEPITVMHNIQWIKVWTLFSSCLITNKPWDVSSLIDALHYYPKLFSFHVSKSDNKQKRCNIKNILNYISKI